MPKVRISIVEYLNTAPLVWGFTDGPFKDKYELTFTVPSLCAEALALGDADVAIIPAIEYQRMENVVALPGHSVAADGAVRSILVVAKKPIEQARRIALDTSSRSSVALVRLLARHWWKIAPEFVSAAPEAAAMLAGSDAALIIGDPALRIAVRLDELASRGPSGEYCCAGDPATLPVPGFETLYLYDVAAEWRAFSGKPCVLAFWTARREAATPEVVADFLASAEYGLARIGEIAEAAALKLEMPAEALERYLRDNIVFSFGEQERAGLEYYFQLAAEAGLISRARPLEFAAATARARV